MHVDWVKPMQNAPRFGALGQAATPPAPPGWTGPWPPPKPPFWDLTGLPWLPTSLPATRPALYPPTLPWPPSPPPYWPAGWDWPPQPPASWTAPPPVPASTPVTPPPGTPGPAPTSTSSSKSGGDSVAYVVGGAIVLGLFVLAAMMSSGAAQEDAED